MNIRTVVLSCTLLFAISLFARQKTDLLVMKNGDRITCEVKSLNAGVLSIALDYVDGTVSVDWSKVGRLESSQLFVVLTQDGSSHEGTLGSVQTVGNEPMRIQIIESQENTVEIESLQVVKMTETSEKIYQRFNGSINLGVIYSKGNSAQQKLS